MFHVCEGQRWRVGWPTDDWCGLSTEERDWREGRGEMLENHEHWFVQTAIKVSHHQFNLYSSTHDWIFPGDDKVSLVH